MTTENQPNTLATLPASQLNIYHELFSLFDKDDSGTIPQTSVGLFCRGMGHCPSEAELTKLQQDLGAPAEQRVPFKKLVEALEQRRKEENAEEELLAAFTNIQAAFTSTSEASKSELMQINLIKKQLTELGEPFSEAELEEFAEFINNTSGLK
jgi:Ca2+-binding EF-hand superfamily protein